MEKEEYKIAISSSGDYNKKKEINIFTKLTIKEFTKLVDVVIDHLENLSDEKTADQ